MKNKFIAILMLVSVGSIYAQGKQELFESFKSIRSSIYFISYKIVADGGSSQKVIIQKTISTLKEKLKDPSSAQISKVRIVNVGADKVVCGEINAKNSYGGYVGNRKFIGAPNVVDIEELDVDNSIEIQAKNSLINDICK